MSNKTKIYKQALIEIDQIRTKNTIDYNENRRILMEKYPRLQGIESELGLIGVKLLKAMMLDPEAIEIEIGKLRRQQKALKQEKEQILEDNNIPKTMLEIQYTCKKCNDGGYINGKKCVCLQKKIMNKVYDQSHILNIIKEEKFEKFKYHFYSKEIDPIEGISHYDNVSQIVSECIVYVSDFAENNGESILLTGEPGVGKTFLCNCIAGALIAEDYSVLYLTASQLFKKLEEQRFNNNKNLEELEELQEWDREVLEADLLIIDDLGTEFITQFTIGELFRIINERQLIKKPMVFSANLDVDQLKDKYTERTSSRILDKFNVYTIFGDDIRVMKKYGKTYGETYEN